MPSPIRVRAGSPNATYCPIGSWAPSALPPGQALRKATPLFKKLDESVVEEEYARLKP